VGVVGGMAVELEGIGAGRVGDIGLRGDGGVTSVCRIELKIALACSVGESEHILVSQEHNEATPFSASDSEGMILFFEGVDGPSSFR
jgi:hypothetical protein